MAHIHLPDYDENEFENEPEDMEWAAVSAPAMTPAPNLAQPVTSVNRNPLEILMNRIPVAPSDNSYSYTSHPKGIFTGDIDLAMRYAHLFPFRIAEPSTAQALGSQRKSVPPMNGKPPNLQIEQGESSNKASVNTGSPWTLDAGTGRRSKEQNQRAGEERKCSSQANPTRNQQFSIDDDDASHPRCSKLECASCNVTEICRAPSFWEAGMDMVRLSLLSHEYREVLNKYMASNSCEIFYKVEKIHRIQNLELHIQYKAQLRKVKREMGECGIPAEPQLRKVKREMGECGIPAERQLWHGTSKANARQICAQGFNRSLCRRASHGVGSYFAVTARMAMEYTNKLPHHKYLILAKVITGKYIVGNDYINGGNLPSSYHSTVNNAVMPDRFAVYHDAAAYPAYLIEFSPITPNFI